MRQNINNTKCKITKNHFLRADSGSWGGFLGVLGASLYWKVVSEFWFGHPKCHFWYPPNPQNGVILAILGVPKMALRVPESKFRDHFSIQTSPQNLQKDTSGTQIGPRKVIFGHFAFFWYFGAIFQATRAIFFKIESHQLNQFVHGCKPFPGHLYV